MPSKNATINYEITKNPISEFVLYSLIPFTSQDMKSQKVREIITSKDFRKYLKEKLLLSYKNRSKEQ